MPTVLRQRLPEPCPAEEVGNRWRFAIAAVVMQMCLGVLYAWGVFRAPLEALYGWTNEQTIAPFRYSLLCLPAGMLIAGPWQDRKGPRLVASVGGLLLGSGCVLAAFIGTTPGGLLLSYGIVAGLGVGFAYVTPIATCLKWFPDKRGFITGLAVMGFGAGSLIFAPLLESLIGRDASQYAQTIPRTFLIMAGVFYVFVIGAAQVYRVPPAGWKPAGWAPPANEHGTLHEFTPREMWSTWQAFALWLIFFLGCAVGQTNIGEAAPLIRELSKHGAAFSAGAAVGVMALFNGIGRLAWGALSDRVGRKGTGAAIFALGALACFACLQNARGFWQGLLGLCIVGFCYGGVLALMPAFNADYYGTKHVGMNYAILFTAFGLAGFFAPQYFAMRLDAARASGDTLGGYRSMNLILGLCALAAMGLALAVRKPKPTQHVLPQRH